MLKVIAFIKHNIRFPSLPEEDSFKYLEQDKKIIVAVADGITRDPIGIKDYPSFEDKKAVKDAFSKYPNPSPAKKAADEFCNVFVDSLVKEKNMDNLILKKAFKLANQSINILNKKHNPSIDYLQNDFWACVASGGIISDDILYWGYICDCGICVFDQFGHLKFRTNDDMKEVANYIDSQGKSFSSADWRKVIRSKFRNNPQNIIDGKLMSYGALTGEETASDFIKVGQLKLEKGDYICFYSDGMEEIIYSKQFSSKLIKKGLSKLKKFVDNISKEDTKYEPEGTLVLVTL